MMMYSFCTNTTPAQPPQHINMYLLETKLKNTYISKATVPPCPRNDNAPSFPYRDITMSGIIISRRPIRSSLDAHDQPYASSPL
jgi:hypothetical protein